MTRLTEGWRTWLLLTGSIVVALGAWSWIARADMNDLADYPNPPGVQSLTAIQVVRSGRTLLRTLEESDTALTAATNTWGNCRLKVPLETTWGRVSLTAYAYGDGDEGGDPAGGSFSWTLKFGTTYGPAETAASGTWSIGDTVLSHDPVAGTALTLTDNDYRWAERPVLANTSWPLPVGVSGTADGIGRINANPGRQMGIEFEVTELTGITTLYILIEPF